MLIGHSTRGTIDYEDLPVLMRRRPIESAKTKSTTPH